MQPTRSIIDYPLLRRTILVNQNVIWQLDGGEHTNPTHDYESVKHLNKNMQHSCNWTILANASTHTRIKKNLETLYIAFLRPSLKDQLRSNKLLLFKNDIT